MEVWISQQHSGYRGSRAFRSKTIQRYTYAKTYKDVYHFEVSLSAVQIYCRCEVQTKGRDPYKKIGIYEGANKSRETLKHWNISSPCFPYIFQYQSIFLKVFWTLATVKDMWCHYTSFNIELNAFHFSALAQIKWLEINWTGCWDHHHQITTRYDFSFRLLFTVYILWLYLPVCTVGVRGISNFICAVCWAFTAYLTIMSTWILSQNPFIWLVNVDLTNPEVKVGFFSGRSDVTGRIKKLHIRMNKVMLISLCSPHCSSHPVPVSAGGPRQQTPRPPPWSAPPGNRKFGSQHRRWAPSRLAHQTYELTGRGLNR